MYADEEIRRRISEAKKKQLRELDLSDCGLTEVPSMVFELKNICSLYLDSNKLKKLPSGISELKSLKILDLSRNQLDNLSIEVFQLVNLQVLDLSDNQLKQLPREISQLKNLRFLGIKNNPLEKPPPEIVERGVGVINNYFKEIDTKGYDYIYEIKLLLVGEGRVGKTSLVKALTIPNYQLENEQTTEGIDIKPWIIPKEEFGLVKDFRLNIWDFGGQEIYHATHQFFLTKRSVYLLVTEARRDDKHEDFYYWLNIIRLLGDESPVIILQNKCDQPYRDIPILEYRKAFNTIIGFLKISCRPEPEHKRSIEVLKFELRNLLKNEILLPHIGSPLPKVWVDIRERLEELKQSGRSYIDRESYLAICRDYGMDEENAIYLSEFLHDLGVILHFNHDWHLRDTIFLDHEWVTRGVYNVFDNNNIKSNRGVFTNNDLLDIWKDEKFKDKRRELLSLMKKFELCFELEEGRYLAPQLLPMDELVYEWRTTENNLLFEYRYKFMPKGILTRLIVKRNKYIYKRNELEIWSFAGLFKHKSHCEGTIF